MHIYARGYAMIDVHEIMLPYAGIIRIRFMGIISATVTRAPLQIKFVFMKHPQMHSAVQIYKKSPEYKL